jgi:hypothetical protein
MSYQRNFFQYRIIWGKKTPQEKALVWQRGCGLFYYPMASVIPVDLVSHHASVAYLFIVILNGQ